MPVRDVILEVFVPDGAKKIMKQRAAGDAVAVVVAVDDDLFLFLDRRKDPLHRLPHVGEEERIVEMLLIGRVKEGGSSRSRADIAVPQKRARQRRKRGKFLMSFIGKRVAHAV